VSGDGRYVAFASSATNLVASDINDGGLDVFMHDRQTGTTQLVSLNGCPTPAQALTGSGSLSVISADGRYVAFYSDATNLVADDSNEVSDVFVRDLQAGTTEVATPGEALCATRRTTVVVGDTVSHHY